RTISFSQPASYPAQRGDEASSAQTLFSADLTPPRLGKKHTTTRKSERGGPVLRVSGASPPLGTGHLARDLWRDAIIENKLMFAMAIALVSWSWYIEGWIAI